METSYLVLAPSPSKLFLEDQSTLQKNTQQPEEEVVPIDEGTQSDIPLPEYAMTKENIHQLDNKLVKAWHKMKSAAKGKGKRKLILQVPTEDDKIELYDKTMHILEDSSKNKILVDE